MERFSSLINETQEGKALPFLLPLTWLYEEVILGTWCVDERETMRNGKETEPEH